MDATKPKRKPPAIDPLSPHGIRVAVVAKLVSKESLAVRGAWGRELQILKRLQARFTADDFWLSLDPAEKLASLSYFVAPFGAGQLKEQWDQHLFRGAMDRQQEQLDSYLRVSTLDNARQTEDAPQVPLKRRETAISWADGE